MATPSQASSPLFTIGIGGMSCVSCVGRVEKTLLSIPGVAAVSVNLATEQARIRLHNDSNTSIQDIIIAIEKTGYQARLNSPIGENALTPSNAFWNSDGLSRVIISAALTTPLLLPMILMPFGIDWILSPGWQLAFATPVQFIFGWRFYSAAFKSLQTGVATMDLLVALGTSAAYGLSLYQMLTETHAIHELFFEGAAVIICMVLLGKWLEARTKRQTSAAIRALQKLWPGQAKVLTPSAADPDYSNLEQYQLISLEHVLTGDHVLVLPGERIPVDGMIINGISHVDESLLTGESMPIKKETGRIVIGGSLNGEGALVIQTRATGVESVLSKIITLVEEAQLQKAPIQKLVDQVSAIFVPSIIIIAIITGIANWIYLDSGTIAILRAVSVLVIACPCALGLATPAAIMAGTGVAARFGILIKDPQVLEHAHRINIVAFDKTGTLTVGHPRLLHVYPLHQTTESLTEILSTAAGLQLGSEHPLAQALLDATKLQNLTPIRTMDSKALPGIGIEGKPISGPWKNKMLSLRSLTSLQGDSEYNLVTEIATTALAAGQTISVLVNHNDKLKVIAVFAFGDAVKANAKQAIDTLHQMHIRCVMLSGDHFTAANRVATAIGIDETFAPIMPANKAGIISSLKIAGNQQPRQWIAMVGDGINDAPALSTADVGMAMATGTDVAMQAAGITLMHGDPLLVSNAITISKKTWEKIQQNLFWAFIFNITGIPLAATGYLSPMIAGSAMALSSFFVLSNALLLNRWQPTLAKTS